MSHSAFFSRVGPRKLGLAVLLAAFMSMSAAVAQQAAPIQTYDVELVIFRNLGERETPESWGVEVAEDAARQLDIPEDDLSEPAAPPTAAAPPVANFPALPASKMKLTAIEETLRRSRGYQPIAHIGWTQPGYARDAANYLSISSLVPASSGLRGQIALTRGRYLHLTLDLVLDGAATGEGSRYVLRQTRRMRSNERHYIDSPKFGVIAIVTPSSE
jgi:hypothetical protein